MAEESAVKVCVRVRPLTEREKASVVDDEPVQLYWRAEKQSIHQIEDVNSGKSFFFDRVFNSDETTNQLYQDFAKPLVVSTVEGYNGTIFAYGQTASGKTFTMMGSDIIPGVIPLAMKDVFQAIKNLPKKEFLLRVSYMEIYNETVTDLLCDSNKRKPLEIREGNNKNVYVGDLTEEVVTSPEQALGWIRKGEKNRHYGKTKMNQRSSRSHTIFRMILESRDQSDTESGESSDGAIIVSHLNLVDLAGSERASQTGAEGARFKEGCNINRSLFTLGQVIKKLSDENQKGFTNYRDSKLTRILQNSLGGNAKTVIICTVTTAVIEETISTLQFASAAKKMKNDPHVTEVSDDGALLKRYRNEIEDLKRRLQEVSQVTQATATEKETLSQLLQERDQLQRDQEDRIKNLTNLLVTSSNFLKRMPKRRVTWGGKLLKATQSDFHDVGESFSLEPLSKVKKADPTVLQEDGEFDFHWEIPEEANFDRTDYSNVAMRGFSDSESLNWIHSDKLSCLELELESETLLKKEAMEKVEALERQLEESLKPTEEQEQIKKQFCETLQLCENLVSEKNVMAEERDYLKQELSIFIEQMGKFEKENAALQQELQDKKDMEEFTSLEEECKKVQEMELQKDISSLKLVLETSELARKELEANLQSVSDELKRKSDLAEELQNLNGKDLVQQVSQLRRSLDDAEVLSRDTKKDWALLRSDNISLKEKAVVLTANHEKMESEVKGLRCQLDTAKTRFIQMQKDLQTELQGTFEENTKLTTLLDGKVPKNLIDSMELEKSVATLRTTVAASQEEAGRLRAQVEELSSLQRLPDQVDCLTKQVQDLTEELGEVKAQRDSLLSASSEERNLTEHRESQLTQQLETLCADLEHASLENLRLLATVEEVTLRLKDSEHVQAAGEQKLCEVQDLVKDLEDKLADSELSRSTEEEIGKELQEERDQLKEILEGLREEKNQLKTDVEEKMEMRVQIQVELQQQQQLNCEQQELLDGLREERDQLKTDLAENVEMMIENQQELRDALEKNCKLKEQILLLKNGPALVELQSQINQLTEQLESVRVERDSLLSEKTARPQNSTEERDQLISTVTSLTGERDQLLSSVTSPMEERDQLLSTVTSLTEERDQLLSTVTSLTEEKDQLLSTVTLLTGERDQLLSTVTSLTEEKDQLLSTETSLTEERDQLLSTETSLTEERDQLTEIVEGLREERNQLKTDEEESTKSMQHMREQVESLKVKAKQLEDNLQKHVEMAAETQGLLHSIQEELQQQMQLNTNLESRHLEVEESLKQQMKQLEDELQDVKQSQLCAKAEVEALQQLLSDANGTISKLKQTSCGTEMAAEGLALRLQDSALQVQEILEKFMRCRETCSEVESAALNSVLPMASTLMKPLLSSLPKHLVKSHCSVGWHGSKTFHTLSDMKLTTRECAFECKGLMEDTVKFDLAVFEERRLQDVLLCRARAPSYSVAQDNLKELWDQRLVHLLDKRPHYLQKMENILKQMEANMACQSAAFSSEVNEIDLFNKELRPLCSSQPLDLDALDALHRREFARRSDVNERQKMALEAIITAKRAHASQVEELRVQAHGQLREERSKTATLLQALESVPAKTEAQLLKDNQQLLLQLEKCRRDHERLPKDAPPSAAELDKLTAKLVKMEVEMIAASSKHQEEIDRVTILLNHKENALRKLKESLRRTQLGEDDSFPQGVDLHARLTATRGQTLQSSVVLEKRKMEEEVQKLKMNITELKSLVSSQQAVITKWKSRAIKAKGKSVAVVEKPLSPCTPTRRRMPFAVENSEVLNVALLHSPKSNFFDIHSGCESMSINCPKQFFDNTSLGTIPDANAGADVNEGLWPLSPKQADLCKQQ